MIFLKFNVLGQRDWNPRRLARPATADRASRFAPPPLSRRATCGAAASPLATTGRFRPARDVGRGLVARFIEKKRNAHPDAAPATPGAPPLLGSRRLALSPQPRS